MTIPRGLEQMRELVLMGEHGAIHLHEQLQAGGPYEAWYPTLRPTQPQLLITLHTDSLDAATGEDATARDWLIAMSGDSAYRDALSGIDLVATTCRRDQVPTWAAQRPVLGATLRSRFTQGVYAQSLRPDWEGVRTPAQSPAWLLDLQLHEMTERHLFVTLDDSALDYGLMPEQSKQALIVRPRLAQRYVDLYLKAQGAYRVNPHYSVNRGLYYWHRLWNHVPTFPPAWAYAVFGERVAPEGGEIRAYMRSLYARLMDMMAAHDRIGWLRYTPANNDTRDEMLSQLNYFIVLATGAFDSLAWLAQHRFQVPEPNKMNISVQAERKKGVPNPFFTKLDVAAPDFATYLRNAAFQDRIALFYEPRHSIQHRLVLNGAHFNTGQYPSDCNVVLLDDAAARAFEVVDRHDPAEEPPFRIWGMMRFAESGDCVLEPYRFTGAALQFLFTFLAGGLECLHLDFWLQQSDPTTKTLADAVIDQDKRPPFATPFPWILVVSVL